MKKFALVMWTIGTIGFWICIVTIPDRPTWLRVFTAVVTVAGMVDLYLDAWRPDVWPNRWRWLGG
jgi:hypothetical protein